MSADLLARAVEQYVFISIVSVYASHKRKRKKATKR